MNLMCLSWWDINRKKKINLAQLHSSSTPRLAEPKGQEQERPEGGPVEWLSLSFVGGLLLKNVQHLAKGACPFLYPYRCSRAELRHLLLVLNSPYPLRHSDLLFDSIWIQADAINPSDFLYTCWKIFFGASPQKLNGTPLPRFHPGFILSRSSVVVETPLRTSSISGQSS